MQMSEDDPNRMEELRKYAAIYGRFDSKRKGEKPMSLHEVGCPVLFNLTPNSGFLCNKQHDPVIDDS